MVTRKVPVSAHVLLAAFTLVPGLLANYSHAAPHRSVRPRWVDEAAFGR